MNDFHASSAYQNDFQFEEKYGRNCIFEIKIIFNIPVFSLAKMFFKSLSHFMIYLFYFYLHDSTNSLMGILRTNRRFYTNARFSKHFYFIFQRIRIFCRFLITLSVLRNSFLNHWTSQSRTQHKKIKHRRIALNPNQMSNFVLGMVKFARIATYRLCLMWPNRLNESKAGLRQ